MTYRSGYWSTPGIRTVTVIKLSSGEAVESVMSTSRSVYNLYLRHKGKIVILLCKKNAISMGIDLLLPILKLIIYKLALKYIQLMFSFDLICDYKCEKRYSPNKY